MSKIAIVPWSGTDNDFRGCGSVNQADGIFSRRVFHVLESMGHNRLCGACIIKGHFTKKI